MKAAPACLRRQRGLAAIEFALVGLAFVIALFVLVEATRVVYMLSMLSQVTRMVARAAIVTSPTAAALKPAKVKAIVAGPDDRSTAFGTDVTVDTIQVKYLGFDLNPVPAPASGNANIAACTAAPKGPACARFVQVQLCQAGTDCDHLEFKPALPLLATIRVPTFLTILPVQSLGCAGPCT
jgi:Flp pilus assembly protein TadG